MHASRSGSIHFQKAAMPFEGPIDPDDRVPSAKTLGIVFQLLKLENCFFYFLFMIVEVAWK